MLTKKHKALMRHTISGHDRNWFGTSFASDDSSLFEDLVTMG